MMGVWLLPTGSTSPRCDTLVLNGFAILRLAVRGRGVWLIRGVALMRALVVMMVMVCRVQSLLCGGWVRGLWSWLLGR